MHGAQSGGQPQILDLFGIDAHDAATSGVHRHQIVTHHQHARRLGCALNGTVAFHTHHSVHNGERVTEDAVQFDDGLGNPNVVQLVLRPSVNRARNHA